MPRPYTWRPDLPDPRDKAYPFVGPLLNLPASVSLRSKFPPSFDQEQEGSCTGNGWAGIASFFEMSALSAGLTGQPFQLDPKAYKDFSRQFIYWNERSIEGTVGQDGGAQVRTGAKVLASVGACSEAAWPYKWESTLFGGKSNVSVRPSDAAFAEAANHRITSYFRLDNTDASQLKHCLAAGFPFVFGFTCFQSLDSSEVAANGMLPMPSAFDLSSGPVGGHCVVGVGYDSARGLFECRNSWGADWGDAGNFWMPEAYITDGNLADDFWTVRL